MAHLEHVNITVPDAHKTAAWMTKVFGWHIRWEGSAMNGQGYTVHIGDDAAYLALYQPPEIHKAGMSNYVQHGGLNHVAVVVADLKAAETAVRAAGFDAHSHADYEPGTRFYFHDQDDIEYEVVCYV